jgi:AtzE family amidohydrolase
MGAQLRSSDVWAGIDPAPVFDPAPVAAVAERPASTSPSAEPIAGVLTEIAAIDQELNAFTTVVFTGAPLVGVPFAVKNLFDVEGVVTLAGSVVRAGDPPAQDDATVVARLRAAGGVLVGATNMDEFAYGFTTENSHYGPTRNPHDTDRIAGGSSGGSAAAVAAGLVTVALGTDTNGSVRIPAAFCGVYGLRPTFGLVPRTGSVLFAPSFDCVGPFARTVADLAWALDVIAERQFASTLDRGSVGLRVARAGGSLWDGASPEVLEAAARVADALGATRVAELPEVDLARAAAIVITAAEGADQHQELLRTDPDVVDVRVRDRFVAGLAVPATDYLAAQRFRRWWHEQVLALLADIDVLVLPTVACSAPLIDQPTIEFGGMTLPSGAVLGRFTQPLSFLGLPALNVPVAGPDGLPLGVQLCGRPYGDGALLAAAAGLEAAGVVGAVKPKLSSNREGVAWK